jgi:GNAT superfamily N-acetyltransferase
VPLRFGDDADCRGYRQRRGSPGPVTGIRMPTREGRPLSEPSGRQVQVVIASEDDADELSRVIADALHDLPQSRWLIPDPYARRQIFPGYFRLLIEQSMASGTVHTTADRVGAALWNHASPDSMRQPGDYAARLAAVAGRWASRFIMFDAALDRHYPARRAYGLLSLLAVRPDRQDQGVGSALLRAHHQVLDRDEGTLTCLTAAGARSRQFYRRHGYLACGVFYLPEEGPAMYPMARPPRAGVPRDAVVPVSGTVVGSRPDP